MSNPGAVLAFDTATTATVVGLSFGGEVVCELADRPNSDERPRHAERLLLLCEQALNESNIGWSDLARIGVGVGPGTFTGLRIGVATAQGLAQASGTPLVAISTLEALSLPARLAEPALQAAAAVDARRGEAYIAAWSSTGQQTVTDRACPPQQLVAELAADSDSTIAVGDGALIFRKELEIGGIAVPDEASPLHHLSGASLCHLAARNEPLGAESLVPRYVRQPDAEISLQARTDKR